MFQGGRKFEEHYVFVEDMPEDTKVLVLFMELLSLIVNDLGSLKDFTKLMELHFVLIDHHLPGEWTQVKFEKDIVPTKNVHLNTLVPANLYELLLRVQWLITATVIFCPNHLEAQKRNYASILRRLGITFSRHAIDSFAQSKNRLPPVPALINGESSRQKQLEKGALNDFFFKISGGTFTIKVWAPVPPQKSNKTDSGEVKFLNAAAEKFLRAHSQCLAGSLNNTEHRSFIDILRNMVAMFHDGMNSEFSATALKKSADGIEVHKEKDPKLFIQHVRHKVFKFLQENMKGIQANNVTFINDMSGVAVDFLKGKSTRSKKPMKAIFLEKDVESKPTASVHGEEMWLDAKAYDRLESSHLAYFEEHADLQWKDKLTTIENSDLLRFMAFNKNCSNFVEIPTKFSTLRPMHAVGFFNFVTQFLNTETAWDLMTLILDNNGARSKAPPGEGYVDGIEGQQRQLIVSFILNVKS